MRTNPAAWIVLLALIAGLGILGMAAASPQAEPAPRLAFLRSTDFDFTPDGALGVGQGRFIVSGEAWSGFEELMVESATGEQTPVKLAAGSSRTLYWEPVGGDLYRSGWEGIDVTDGANLSEPRFIVITDATGYSPAFTARDGTVYISGDDGVLVQFKDGDIEHKSFHGTSIRHVAASGSVLLVATEDDRDEGAMIVHLLDSDGLAQLDETRFGTVQSIVAVGDAGFVVADDQGLWDCSVKDSSLARTRLITGPVEVLASDGNGTLMLSTVRYKAIARLHSGGFTAFSTIKMPGLKSASFSDGHLAVTDQNAVRSVAFFRVD